MRPPSLRSVVAGQVETVVLIDGSRVHRFQVVRERREGDESEEWIVVGFGDGDVHLADPAFEWTRSVPVEAFREGRFEPLVAGGVPGWGD